MSFLFVVPTIMTRPQLEISNVENLAKNFTDSRILFVSNTDNPAFAEYTPLFSNITKYISGTKFSISKALNVGLSEFIEDYFIFVQSDIHISKDAILHFKEIYENIENAGVLGVKNHSGFNIFSRRINYPDAEIFEVLWADAVMFIGKDVISKVGTFNEDYLGDRESQEYCYRVRNEGYRNLYIKSSNKGEWNHLSLGFDQKVKPVDKGEFSKVVNNSTRLFYSRWQQWEEQQKSYFFNN